MNATNSSASLSDTRGDLWSKLAGRYDSRIATKASWLAAPPRVIAGKLLEDLARHSDSDGPIVIRDGDQLRLELATDMAHAISEVAQIAQEVAYNP